MVLYVRDSPVFSSYLLALRRGTIARIERSLSFLALFFSPDVACNAGDFILLFCFPPFKALSLVLVLVLFPSTCSCMCSASHHTLSLVSAFLRLVVYGWKLPCLPIGFFHFRPVMCPFVLHEVPDLRKFPTSPSARLTRCDPPIRALRQNCPRASLFPLEPFSRVFGLHLFFFVGSFLAPILAPPTPR